MKVDDSLNDALKKGLPMPAEQLQVLQDTTLALVRNRGMVSDEALEKFYRAGYGHQQLLEIIVGIAQKVMSNYTNHLSKTPIDKQFEPFAN